MLATGLRPSAAKRTDKFDSDLASLFFWSCLWFCSTRSESPPFDGTTQASHGLASHGPVSCVWSGIDSSNYICPDYDFIFSGLLFGVSIASLLFSFSKLNCIDRNERGDRLGKVQEYPCWLTDSLSSFPHWLPGRLAMGRTYLFSLSWARKARLNTLWCYPPSLCL